LRVLVTGGKTGGHLYPALAVMEALKERKACDFLFVGTKKGIEAKVVPLKNIPFHTVWISGFYRGKIAENLLFPFKMMVSMIQSLFLVHRFHPDVVLGTGGYVSWPVLTAAVLLRKRTLIQEQNIYPGLVTRLLSSHMDGVYLSYKSSRKYFRRQSNLIESGNPTRKSLEKGNPQEGYKRFGLRSDRLTLFVFGGSQGARGINRAILSVLDRLMMNKTLQLLWAAGPRWAEEVLHRCEVWQERIKVLPFIHEMNLAYAVSDLIVCRSGATTIAEIARLGLPALFIPYPAAAGGHQKKNAEMLVEAGAAQMMLEEMASPGKLGDLLIHLLENQEQREQMSRRIKTMAAPRAAEMIAEDMIRRTEV